MIHGQQVGGGGGGDYYRLQLSTQSYTFLNAEEKISQMPGPELFSSTPPPQHTQANTHYNNPNLSLLCTFCISMLQRNKAYLEVESSQGLNGGERCCGHQLYAIHRALQVGSHLFQAEGHSYTHTHTHTQTHHNTHTHTHTHRVRISLR